VDKRSLIAVVVTFLILILWQAFYLGPRQKETRLKEAQRLEEQAAADSSGSREGGRKAPVTGAEEERGAERPREERGLSGPETNERLTAKGAEEPAERVTVRVITEKIEVELGSLGGDIEGVRLIEHLTDRGEPVELIPENEPGGLDVRLISGGEEESFSGRNFSVSIDGMKVSQDRLITLNENNATTEIVFRSEAGEGDFIEKRFTFFRDDYQYEFDVKIGREGPLRDAEAYRVAWGCGLAVTEEKEDWDRRSFASMGRVGEEFYKEDLGDFKDQEEKPQRGMVVWMGARTKYFLSALIEESPMSGTLLMTGNKEAGRIGYAAEYPFRGDPRRVKHHYTGYLGPLDMDRLEEFGVGLEESVELGFLRFFSVIILRIMVFLRGFIPNYGLIIIIFSILTKVLFYRLTHKSFKSMKDMQRLQPRVKELQEKYKDDKEKLNKATMKLYKEAGVNPLGGCLPLLLQMPVFWALFNVLRNTIELRNAPFALWIQDLSSPDVLFSFGFSIPFLGSEFHLLPILMGGAMLLQTKLGGSATGEAAPGQSKMMSMMMPIIFMFFFYGMPSGLVLYWIVNNILTIIQQYYAHKEVEKEDGEKKLAANKAEDR